MTKTTKKLTMISLCAAFATSVAALVFPLTDASAQTTNTPTPTNTAEFYANGASVRIDKNTVAGIRYEIVVDGEWYDTLSQENEGKTITFGAYVAPNSSFTSIEELNAGLENVMTLTSGTREELTDGFKYTVSVMYDLTKLLEEVKNNTTLNPSGGELTEQQKTEYLRQTLAMDLTARPYYAVDGTVAGYGSADNGTRSIRGVIDASLIANEEIDDEVVDLYLKNQTTATVEDVYFDPTTKQLLGYTAEAGKTYTWDGRPLTFTEADGKITLSDAIEVVAGQEYYISAFDAESNVERIPVKAVSKIINSAADLQAVFGSTDTLDGYYVLGQNIDASTATLSGAIRHNSVFSGTFDGLGYTISNLDVSTTAFPESWTALDTRGSLFGKIQYPALIQNVGFTKVNANYAAVISSRLMGQTKDGVAVVPTISNVYIDASNTDSYFAGVVASKDNQSLQVNINNVIVNYPVQDKATDNNRRGSFFGCEWFKDKYDGVSFTNNYVISLSPLSYYYAYSQYDEFEGITRYETLADMAKANNDLSSFSNKYWLVNSGIANWKTTGAVADVAKRAYSIADGTLDLTGLGIAQTDITAVEINGVKYDVTDGVFPTMTLVHSTTAGNLNYHYENYKLTLTVNGTDTSTIDYVAADNDFAGVTFTVHTTTSVYTLSNVRVYSDVITTAKELETLFSSQDTLSGYYVLGGHINASTASLTGSKRALKWFTGIFDGMGYTISNLDVSTTTSNLDVSTTTSNGSLFGLLYSNSVVKNVAFTNVKANGASVITANAQYGNATGDWGKPMISNVYVQVSSDTTDFYGIVGAGPNHTAGHVTMKNVIVKYEGTITGDDTTTAKGAFVGYNTTYLTTASAMVCSDCYLISTEYITTLNNAEVYPDTDIVRYDDADQMKQANNDYSSFNYCWTVADGEIPVWAKLPTE
ncbi:MAG: hypothetical protein IJ506_06035 [Clostridia bacterium]|nr:hypothetical protein [Clostridia bacterium]